MESNAVESTVVGEFDDDRLIEVETTQPINGHRVNRFTPEELVGRVVAAPTEAPLDPQMPSVVPLEPAVPSVVPLEPMMPMEVSVEPVEMLTDEQLANDGAQIDISTNGGETVTPATSESVSNVEENPENGANSVSNITENAV